MPSWLILLLPAIVQEGGKLIAAIGNLRAAGNANPSAADITAEVAKLQAAEADRKAADADLDAVLKI